MKNSIRIALFSGMWIFISLATTSCLDSDVTLDNSSIEQVEQQVSEINSTADDVISETESFLNASSISYVKSNVATKQNSVAVGPKITVEPEDSKTFPKKITVDYGNGIPVGKWMLRGIIVIVKTDNTWIKGSETTYTFEKFFVDDDLLQGKKTVTNMNDEKVKRLGLYTDYKWTKADAKTNITVSSERVRERISDNDTPDDYKDDIYSFTGFYKGDSNNNSFSMEIEKPLIIKMPYRYFVSGTYTFSIRKTKLFYDFGNGELDNIVYVSSDSGTEKKELKY